MSFLIWILLGLVAGALAKFLMPGPDPGGWIMTILLGIAGAVFGGWIFGIIGLGTVSGFNLGSILTATAGAFLLLFLYRKFA